MRKLNSELCQFITHYPNGRNSFIEMLFLNY